MQQRQRHVSETSVTSSTGGAAALEGCRGHDRKMLGAHSLPPLLQSVLSRGQIADDNGSAAFVKEATFNLSSSLFRLSGFLMTDGEARKGGGREGGERRGP